MMVKLIGVHPPKERFVELEYEVKDIDRTLKVEVFNDRTYRCSCRISYHIMRVDCNHIVAVKYERNEAGLIG